MTYRFNLLIKAHVRQATRKGAHIWNMGWVADDDVYLSKTDKGLLTTERQADGTYVHTWQQDDGRGSYRPGPAPLDIKARG